MTIAPVGLLLLVGAGLLIWWLAKQAPGWVVALLGGGLVLLAGFAALFSFAFVRTESRVVRGHERHGAQQTVDEANGRPRGPAAKVESSDDNSSTFVSKEEWPYRGKSVADKGGKGDPANELSVPADVILAVPLIVVGVGLLAGFIALSIYLFKKNPAWIVLPVFGVPAFLIVVMGFAWLSGSSSSPEKYDLMSSASDEADNDFSSSSPEDSIAILAVRYEVRAPASGGTVKDVLVADGAHVRKDEILLRLENKEIEQSRKKKLAAIAETDKQLKDEDDTGRKTELEKTRSTQQAELDAIDEQIAELEIKSAIAGHVEAPKLSGMLNQIVKGGELILHVVVTTESVEPDEVPVVEAKPDPPVTQPPPDWIHIPSRRVDGADQRTVDIGPYPNPDEYEKELLEKIHAVISKYVRGILGVDAHPQFRVSERYIYDKIIKAEYIESRDFQLPVGRMKHKYVLLEFDNRTKGEIKEMHTMERRLGTAGFGSCLLLMLIGTVYGYLKLDTQTKGYYSGRLKLAATAGILCVVILAANLYGYYW